MKHAWKKALLSELLEPVTRREPVQPFEEYRLLGIRLEGGGPFHRETKMGSQIRAPNLSRVSTGDFLYSRLFAWRGAFGCIGPDLDGCYVSDEFPTFVPVSGEIDIEFLRLWFRLPSTISKVEECCMGSTPLTRNRFKEPFFLGMEISIPPIEEQRRIVDFLTAIKIKVDAANN